MSFFQFRWLRRYLRRHTNYIAEDKALFWKRRLTYLYIFFAWNAFGLVAYTCFTGKADWAEKYKSDEEKQMTPAQQWATTLNIKDAAVFRLSGLNMSQYEIANEEK